MILGLREPKFLRKNPGIEGTLLSAKPAAMEVAETDIEIKTSEGYGNIEKHRFYGVVDPNLKGSEVMFFTHKEGGVVYHEIHVMGSNPTMIEGVAPAKGNKECYDLF